MQLLQTKSKSPGFLYKNAVYEHKELHEPDIIAIYQVKYNLIYCLSFWVNMQL